MLALALVMGVSLGACSGDDTYLPALLEDPMASYEADGLVLIDSWERAEGHSIVTDKPVHAEVGRRYRITDQSEAEQLLDAAAAFAESQGWTLEYSGEWPTVGYGGEKALEPDTGTISIALLPQDPASDPDGPRVLRVYLRFGSVRFDSTPTSIVEGE